MKTVDLLFESFCHCESRRTGTSTSKHDAVDCPATSCQETTGCLIDIIALCLKVHLGRPTRGGLSNRLRGLGEVKTPLSRAICPADRPADSRINICGASWREQRTVSADLQRTSPKRLCRCSSRPSESAYRTCRGALEGFVLHD